MTIAIPTTEPIEVRAGDTVKWTRLLSDYPPSIWTLSYALRGLPGEINITATDNGDGSHLVSVTPATTVAWKPGRYSWTAKVTNGSDVYTVDSGFVEILEDLSEISGAHDTRSHARKMLDALEAVLEGRASRSDTTYRLPDGRSLQNMTHLELRNEWIFWHAKVVQEERAAGLRPGNRILVRFTR